MGNVRADLDAKSFALIFEITYDTLYKYKLVIALDVMISSVGAVDLMNFQHYILYLEFYRPFRCSQKKGLALNVLLALIFADKR
jgi:hypothetical protein